MSIDKKLANPGTGDLESNQLLPGTLVQTTIGPVTLSNTNATNLGSFTLTESGLWAINIKINCNTGGTANTSTRAWVNGSSSPGSEPTYNDSVSIIPISYGYPDQTGGNSSIITLDKFYNGGPQTLYLHGKLRVAGDSLDMYAFVEAVRLK